jgi:hypothetical protein
MAKCLSKARQQGSANSALVEHLPHNPMVKGSNPACTRTEIEAKNSEQLFQNVTITFVKNSKHLDFPFSFSIPMAIKIKGTTL